MALRAAARGISPVTVNRNVAELRSALGKAVQWGFLDVHPLARMKPVKTHAGPIVRWLSEDEEMRLRAALEFSRGAGFGPHVFARNRTAKNLATPADVQSSAG